MQAVIEWWEDLETGMKWAVGWLSFVVLGVLALCVVFPPLVLFLLIIGAVIATIASFVAIVTRGM